ncbi:MAG: GAP family protein, partial [Thiogranum sp.]
ASLTIAVPVAGYFMARHSAEAIFAACKGWLIRNNANIIIVLLLVFGALLVGQGVKILVV